MSSIGELTRRVTATWQAVKDAEGGLKATQKDLADQERDLGDLKTELVRLLKFRKKKLKLHLILNTIILKRVRLMNLRVKIIIR